MDVRTCIEHLKDKLDKLVCISWSKAEYHQENTAVFLSDIKQFGASEFITERILESRVVSVTRYTKEGIKCINIIWEG